MVKGIYQLCHALGWNCCTLNRKGIQCVDDIWDSEQQNFFTRERTQEKSNLTPTEVGDWEELMNKNYGQWCHLLDTDLDTTQPGQWIGFYVDGEEVPTFVIQCDIDFAPSCMQLYHLTLPLPIKYALRLAPIHGAIGNGNTMSVR